MKGSGFTIDLSPLKAKLKVVESAAFKRSVARSAAQAALGQVEKAFRTEGAHYGEPWVPRAESTIKTLTARKRKKNGKLGNARKPKKLLVSSGTLRKSFYVEDSGADSFSIATPVRYAKYHEYGTQKMPSRPVMPIDPVLGKPRGEKVERAIREAVEARVKLALGMK